MVTCACYAFARPVACPGQEASVSPGDRGTSGNPVLELFAISSELMQKKHVSVCILARKRLFRNTRVVRQAKALSEAGYSVTVVAIELPSPQLRKLTPDVRYIEVELNPWPRRVLLWLNSRRNRILGIRRRWSGLLRRTRNRILLLLRKFRMFLRRRILSLRRHLLLIKKVRMAVRRRLLAVKRHLKPAMSCTLHDRSGTPDAAPRGKIHTATGREQPPAGEKQPPAGGTTGEDEPQGDSPPVCTKAARTVAPPAGGRLKAASDVFYQFVRRKLIPFMDSANTLSFAARALQATEGMTFDICQAHDTYSLPAACRLARRSGAELVYDALEIPDDRSGIAADGVPRWLRLWESRREERLIRASAKVFAVGPTLAEWTASRYSIEKPVVVRNCCLYRDHRVDEQVRRDLNLAPEDKIGVVVGSIYRDQGLEQLIDAIGLMDDNIHIAALGPEAQRGFADRLRERIEARGATGRFHILPPRPPEELHGYLSGFDLGIIARQNTCLNNEHSLPNKIFELIMARLPVVTSRLPNIVSIVTGYEIGDVFDETDPVSMAETINRMMEPERLSRYKEKVIDVAGILSWENESRIYVETISDLAGSARG